MRVILRTKVEKSGSKSLFLDIHTDSRRYKEYLGLVLKPPTSPKIRDDNKRLKEKAEAIRVNREKQLIEEGYSLKSSIKNNVDFVAYYQKFVDDYKHSDLRIVKYSLHWFKEYLSTQNKKSIKANHLDEKICKGYLDHMQKGLNGETPYNYFTKFKRVIKQAIKEELIYKNPTDGIKVIRDEGLKKDVLSYAEIAQLAKAHCPNQEVKRAFLFSLYTGLRWCDVKELTFKNIDFANNNFKYTQAKTKTKSKKATNTIGLSPMLLKLIGEPQKPNDKIFNLPSHTGALKTLDKWVENAEITKNITWHCARHSFAVNQLSEQKTDIKTVADLMGHSGLKYVERYSRSINEKKAQAINAQPEVEFE